MGWTQDERWWNTLGESYLAAADDPARRDAILAQARERLGEIDNNGWRWLSLTVGDPRPKGRFAVDVLRSAGPHLDDLFEPMVRAAVYEKNPSTNPRFVRPALRAFGARRVNEALFGYLESGTNAEKAGAINALYWSEILLDPSSTWPPTDEQIAIYPTLTDVWRRKQILLLREFVRNHDVEVRRSAIGLLRLNDPDAFPREDRHLIAGAVRIGQAHPDEYIRYRTRIQLDPR